jgi:hypothetical protein
MVLILTALLSLSGDMRAAVAGPPAYEHAYAEGRIVTISIQDPHPGQSAQKAHGIYFEVIYPIGWELLTESVPQCNPCDHLGDGEDYFDYHDHVFSAAPSSPAKGYRPLWQLNIIVPAYSDDLAHNLAVSEAYASYLPLTSAADVAELLEATLGDGTPIALRLEEDYVFRATIVNENAAP